MSSKPKLSHRFIATMTVVSCALVTMLVFFVVVIEDQIEVISLHHWLDTEANRYFRHVDSDTPYIPNPEEFNYYTSDKKTPAWLTNYKNTGFYEHEIGPEDRHFLVRKAKDSGHLFYLVFRKDADDFLDSYESSLITFTVTLSSVFLLTMILFSTYLVRLITKPFNRLNKKIDELTPNSPDLVRDASYQEFQVIEDALYQSKKRIDLFFKREQEFSRFAAHEIRTPLMVLKGSSELLNHINTEQPLIKKAANRISTATNDISILINTFLLLGKEHIESSFYQQVDMQVVVTQCLSDADSIFKQRQLTIDSQLENNIYISAPHEFVDVLISNLIKNSFTYVSDKATSSPNESDISISLSSKSLTISNRYETDEEKSGYGYGLVIVKRICQRLDWQFQLDKSDTQFSITIKFS